MYKMPKGGYLNTPRPPPPPRAYLNTPPLPHMNKVELRQCTEILTNYIMVQIIYLTYQ